MHDHERIITSCDRGFNLVVFSSGPADSPGADVERPANKTRLPDIAPIARQRSFDLDNRIESALGDKAGGGGPRSHVSNELRERPARLQHHGEKSDLVERKRHGLVAVE